MRMSEKAECSRYGWTTRGQCWEYNNTRILVPEELNLHFSSVFTREDKSSLPVPETKLNRPEGERLGQLYVTPEVVVSKIS